MSDENEFNDRLIMPNSFRCASCRFRVANLRQSGYTCLKVTHTVKVSWHMTEATSSNSFN